MLAAEYIDGSAAANKVKYHLRRYRLRVGIDQPCCRDPMVAGKNDDMRMDQDRMGRALQQADPERDLFQLPERSKRFGLIVDPVLERLAEAHACVSYA